MSIKYKGQTVANVGGVGSGESIPSGGIIMWSGSTVPDGWALCDGENGTPDLRGRFVLGSSDSHAIGSVGGSEEVTLTVEQMPEHNHNFYRPNYLKKINNPEEGTPNTLYSNGTGSYETEKSGNSHPHPNMPPYYTLAYIMKL